ncbi:MAG: NUDIX hydrolase [Candidatus Hodarchaeota archaeon]
MVNKWKKTSVKHKGSFKIFDVKKQTYINPMTGEEVPTFVIKSNDWINIIATTLDDEIVLIKQFRFGSNKVELEIPGGLVENGEEPAAAAARELKEETGYAGDEAVLIGAVNPNPAIHEHTCYTYWIPRCQKVQEPSFDDANEIIETELASVNNVKKHVKEGRITHSLVIDAIFWFLLKMEKILV